MAFKLKTKNRVSINTRQTLDAHHNDAVEFFNYEREQLNVMNDEYNNMILELEELEKKSQKNTIMDIEEQKKIWELKDKIDELKQYIEKVKHKTEENNYILTTSKLLHNYYKIVEDEKNNNYNNINLLTKKNKNSVMEWFNTSDNASSSAIMENLATGEKTLTLIRKSVPKNAELKREDSKNNDSTLDNNLTKDVIYDKYMRLVDKNYISNDNILDDELNDVCAKCITELLLNNNAGFLVCPKCGYSDKIIIDSDKPSYKEPPKEITSFCYKRINHFNEFLAQFQAKETTDISEDLYNEIREELKKEKIINMKLLTPKKMKEILKKIKRNDYYEHIPYIINQFNGLPAPVIAPEIEEILRGMFKAIQIPFDKFRPAKRKNFLSYNYVMYKFFELLELDEYLFCFQLLKSRTKLYEQDKLWKNICNDLQWEFISSL
jgi:uncharacterized Zn finger protein (UPF0148 family)